MFSAMLGVMVMDAGLVFTFRIIDFPAEAWAQEYGLGANPPWLAWLFVIMAALVAGVTEEVGFRGSMQVPLEKRYGPAAGIVIGSMVFVIFHLNQAWAPPVLVHLFVISVLWGILAYASGSLIPSMISHVVADVVNFAYWWTDVAGTFYKLPIAKTVIDAHFVLWATVLVASGALLFWAARITLAARRFG